MKTTKHAGPRQPPNLSVKAHLAPPPRTLGQRGQDKPAARGGRGQFTGEGTSPLEKK